MKKKIKRKLKKPQEIRLKIDFSFNKDSAYPVIKMLKHQNSYQLLAEQYARVRFEKEPELSVETLKKELRRIIIKSVGIQEEIERRRKAGDNDDEIKTKMLDELWKVLA